MKDELQRIMKHLMWLFFAMGILVGLSIAVLTLTIAKLIAD